MCALSAFVFLSAPDADRARHPARAFDPPVSLNFRHVSHGDQWASQVSELPLNACPARGPRWCPGSATYCVAGFSAQRSGSRTVAFHREDSVGFGLPGRRSRFGYPWTTTIAYFEAQSRSLHSRYPQLQTTPYAWTARGQRMPVGSLLTCRSLGVSQMGLGHSFGRSPSPTG